MKTEPPSVSARPLTDVRGSIYRTVVINEYTYINENFYSEDAPNTKLFKSFFVIFVSSW